YAGTSGNFTSDFGSSVRGKAPSSLMSAFVPATVTGVETNSSTSLNDSSLWHTLTGLVTGEPYYVRVSARNSRGLSLPQASNPAYLAPPRQVPASPEAVTVFPATSSSIRVLWSAPPANGGSWVTKYKIEWDTNDTFASGAAGGPLGSHQRVVTNASQCGLTPCEYTVPSLTKGQPYHVRVFAYNTEGFSASGTLSSPQSEAPCTQAHPPSRVYVSPASETSLMVEFEQSPDDGGKPVIMYKVEWDMIGVEGYTAGGSPSSSLLYSPVDIQAIEASASANDLEGYFFLAYRGMVSDPIPADASAEEFEEALKALPSAPGGLSVSREAVGGDVGRYGYRWIVSLPAATCQEERVGLCPRVLVSADDTLYGSEFAEPDESSGLAGLVESEGEVLTGSDAIVTAERWIEGWAGYDQQVREEEL
ncbi:unnamed protein product, partial [Discosporangium mesarthrocarpum]